MDVVAAYGCVAVLCAFAAGYFAVARTLSRRARPSFAAEGNVRQGRLAVLLRDGIPATLGLARLLLGSRNVAPLVQEGVLVCEERGYRTAPAPLLSVTVVALVLGAAVMLLATGSLVAALAVPSCAVVLLSMMTKSLRESRLGVVQESIPEVLRSIGVCQQAGFTLVQTFEQVAKEAKGPLGRAFAQAAHLLEAGRPASEALAMLRDSTSIPELSFVAVALQVQHEAGGSMRQVLDAARDTVEGEIELKRSLRVHTAQAKLSARIVSAMPLILVALFSVISEGFLTPFFSSPMGLGLLALAIAMQVAGIVAVRRTLAMEIAL